MLLSTVYIGNKKRQYIYLYTLNSILSQVLNPRETEVTPVGIWFSRDYTSGTDPSTQFNEYFYYL